MRLRFPEEDLVFSGERLRSHVEELLGQRKTLDVLIKASRLDEELPGSIKTFYSREFGDDFNPELRPALEIEWCAPALWVEEWPFVLEAGEMCTLRPRQPLTMEEKATLAASMQLEPAEGAGALPPEVWAVGWNVDGTATGSPHPLEIPLQGTSSDLELRLSAAVNPILAGEKASISLLETWAPLVERPQNLIVPFYFISPSGRQIQVTARHVGSFRYVADILPDEISVWTYTWKVQTDKRFKDHEGRGYITVMKGTGQGYLKALGYFTTNAVRDARRHKGLLSRRQAHFRLTALEQELHRFATEEEVNGAPPAALKEIQVLLAQIAGVLPLLD
jgi:hypothetical protein